MISLLLIIGLFAKCYLVLPGFTEFSNVAALPGVVHVVPSFSLPFIVVGLCIICSISSLLLIGLFFN